MEEPFNPREEGGEARVDINLCIFPHLQELILVDLRGESPRATLVNVAEVFDEEFYQGLEKAFSQLLREKTEYPFSHFMTVPVRMEELIREAGLVAILEKVNQGQPMEEFPRVAVLLVSGSALSLNTDQLTRAFQTLLGERADPGVVTSCVEMMERLMAQEKEVLRKLEREELREALEGRSRRFFTLWEKRN